MFTGTGFSKAVTEGKAPGWQQLLELVCTSSMASAHLVPELFPADGGSPLSLEEAAQVIQIQLANAGRNMHDEIAQIVGPLTPSGNIDAVRHFLKENKLNIITTNYDKLVEQMVDANTCLSFAPGLPIPRAITNTNVYHVHGSIDSPTNMVVTADDYFRFINSESFFSRKLSTVLHEETIVILGYSLGDTNLKAILSDYRGFSKKHFVGGNIFLASRQPVSQITKDYYGHCYGIRVIDQIEIDRFFKMINFYLPEAKKSINTALPDINEVLFKGHFWTDNYLHKQYSFFEIVASVAAIGKSISDPLVVNMLSIIIQKKTEFTTITNAWEQYENLAEWLVYIGSILELRGTMLEDMYLVAVARSFSTMSSSKTPGYSWYAYNAWDRGWPNIHPANRALIREYCAGRISNQSAVALLARA
nr:SIR2 family protein [Burkholderia gladioli]